MNIAAISLSNPYISNTSGAHETRMQAVNEALEQQKTQRGSDPSALAAVRDYHAEVSSDITEIGDIGSEQRVLPGPNPLKPSIDEAKEKQRKREETQAVQTLLENFDYLDRLGSHRGKANNLISVDDLKAALENPKTSKELKAAISYVLGHSGLLEKLDVANKTVDARPDGKFGRKDFEGFLKQAETKTAATSPAKTRPDNKFAPVGPASAPADQQPAEADPKAQAAIEKARSMVGKQEDTDKDELQELTGVDPTETPWCASFAMNILIEAGVIDPKGLDNPRYCPSVVEWAKQEGIWGEPGSYTPKPGDAIVYDFQNDGVADHMGIVEAVSETALVVIEGNSGSNGEVRRKDNLSPTYKGIMGFVIGGKPH